MRNTDDDMEKEENNKRNKNLCNPPHRVHIDAICPIARGMFEKPKNWNEEFNLLRLAQSKRFEENKRKAQLIQKKLLALAHQADTVEDHPSEENETRKEDESTPLSDGNMAQGNMINLECNEDETEEPNQDANLTDRSQKEVYKTHERPTCSKIHKEPCEGVTGRKSTEAQITEVDLVSDSDEEKEKPRKEVGCGKRALQVTQTGFTLELKIQNGDGTNSTTINLTASEGPKRNTSNK